VIARKLNPVNLSRSRGRAAWPGLVGLPADDEGRDVVPAIAVGGVGEALLELGEELGEQAGGLLLALAREGTQQERPAPTYSAKFSASVAAGRLGGCWQNSPRWGPAMRNESPPRGKWTAVNSNWPTPLLNGAASSDRHSLPYQAAYLFARGEIGRTPNGKNPSLASEEAQN
jgi:hypothetical protein